MEKSLEQIEVLAIYLGETNKAYHLDVGNKAAKKVWLPKSQVKIKKQTKKKGLEVWVIRIPGWLLVERGIVPNMERTEKTLFSENSNFREAFNKQAAIFAKKQQIIKEQFDIMDGKKT